MAIARPVLRIFDYPKAIEFYIDWLGFKIDWEHTPNKSPIYLQVSYNDIALHLTEHHGDCSPGARIHIDNFEGLREYHKNLILKKYKYNNPGIGPAFYDPKILCMEVTDPFGNRLTFTGPKES